MITKEPSSLNSLKVSSPGRICLFGEHQDYLSLPVVSAAISLRVAVKGTRRKDSYISMRLPDIGLTKRFRLNKTLRYTTKRDYFRSGVNVLHHQGYTFSNGFNCEVRSEIPLKAGASSSSAMVAAWIQFLALISDQRVTLTQNECAYLAHQAEVVEFHEPGGMMDHYSSSYGGVLHLKFFPSLSVSSLKLPLKRFVLGDSQQPKNTRKVLSMVKNQITHIVRHIRAKHPDFSLHTIDINDLPRYNPLLTAAHKALLHGTVRNRDITGKAIELLRKRPFNEKRFSALLNEHQTILRDVLKISTPKIDAMLTAAVDAGAICGKINGSGGGGSMFVYAPEHPHRIAEAIEREGGKAYIISIDEGTRIEYVK
jgi:galactokinase